jgi:hypothetical protein
MEIHLEDCSSLWADYIQDATESIVVFTPYFDWLLINLFSSCELPYSDIYLVTQLDRIDSRSENITRINRIVELVNLGVNVRILDRLHAKVLLVDDEHAFFGSQNFTNYSTESIEITTQISRSEDDADDFFDYFANLLLEARKVTQLELAVASGAVSALLKGDDDDDDDDDYDDDDDDDDD